jgi:hypothetical protein
MLAIVVLLIRLLDLGMRAFFARAIANVTQHGDTDIFPFPIENHIFFDQREDVLEILDGIDTDIREALARYSPSNYSVLAPVSYTGFRWALRRSIRFGMSIS